MQLQAVVPLALVVLPVLALSECNRRPPPAPEVDCSAYNTVCHVPHEENGTVYYTELETPQDNTRICYRTCIDAGQHYDRCEASATHVYHQPLKKQPSTSHYSLQRIFSPNFQAGKDYRKSTICRYNVKCADDQLLSYSFITHSLEGRGRCSGSNECLDRLTMKLPTYGGYVQTTCANEVANGILFQDGLTELSVQFTTNRAKQYPGFNMFVWCVNQDFQLGTGAASSVGRSQSHSQTCTMTPTDRENSRRRRKRETLRHIRRRRVSSEDIIVRNGEWVSFVDGTVTVTSEGSGPNCTRTYAPVIRLLVSNRFNKYKFDQSQGQRYGGYGILLLFRTYKGYFVQFNQEGVDPKTKPTHAERNLIAQLERGLAKAFQPEYFFDVWDPLDANETTIHHERQRRVVDSHVAVTYGTACNGQLRAVACAYQEVVLQRDCITDLPLPQVQHVTLDLIGTGE